MTWTTRDPNSMGTTVSTVWLAIHRARRPVRYAYLAAELKELTHNQRAPALKLAYRLGYIERTGVHRAYEYSVTPECNIPPGLRLRDVLEGVA